MGRRIRKNRHKQTATVGWVDVWNSFRWLCSYLWRLFCLTWYLNPLRYLRDKAPAVQGGVVFLPPRWTCFVNTFRSEETIKRRLLDWAQSHLSTFDVVDFGDTWCDGVALCALLDSVCPGSCLHYDLLKTALSVNNCRLGLHLCYRYLSLPQALVTAEEMASGKADDKVRILLQHVQWAEAQRGGHVTDITWSRTKRPVRAADGGVPCFAKGGGLLKGVIGKKCKFNLFISDNTHITIEINIKGPGRSTCHARITCEVPTPSPEHPHKGVHEGASQSSQVKRDTNKVSHLWFGFPGRILFGNKKHSHKFVSSIPPVDAVNRHNRIPLGYQCISDNHLLVSYTPLKAGNHVVSIRWGGEPIPGSPFITNVAESVQTLVTDSPSAYQKDAPNEAGLGDENNEAQSQRSSGTGNIEQGLQTVPNNPPETASTHAATPSHTSTVHLVDAMRSSTARRVITRKRVLRKVMVVAGQEIILEETGPQIPSTHCIREPSVIGKRTTEQLRSLGAKRNHMPDIDISSKLEETSEFVTSKANIPPRSPMGANRHAPDSDDHINQKDSGRQLGAVTVRSPDNTSKSGYQHNNVDTLISSSGVNTERKSTDTTVKPISHTQVSGKTLISAQLYDDFKMSKFLSTSIGNTPENIDMNQKLLEGGFITQTAGLNKAGHVESNSTQDSGSDGASIRDVEKSFDSTSTSGKSDNGSALQRGILCTTSKEKLTYSSMVKQRMDLIQHNSNNPNHRLIDNSFGHSLVHILPDESRPTKDSTVKKAVSKIFLDPTSSVKNESILPKSNTNNGSSTRMLMCHRSDNLPQAGDSDSTNLDLCQSTSLNKSCIYIRHKLTDNTGTWHRQESTSDMTSALLAPSPKRTSPNGQSCALEATASRDVKEQRRNSQGSETGRIHEHQCHTLSEVAAKSKHLFKLFGHRKLTRSLSYPSKSNDWSSLEMNQVHMDNSQVLDAVKVNHRKRATLGGFHRKNQLREFQQTEEIMHSKTIAAAVRMQMLGPSNLPSPPTPVTIFSESLDFESAAVDGVTIANTKVSSPKLSGTIRRDSIQRQDVYEPKGFNANPNAGSPFSTNIPNFEQHNSNKENKKSDKSKEKGTIGAEDKQVKLLSYQKNFLKQELTPKLLECSNRAAPKVDCTTQVTYSEIKKETGWICPSVCMVQRKQTIQKEQNTSSDTNTPSQLKQNVADGLGTVYQAIPTQNILSFKCVNGSTCMTSETKRCAASAVDITSSQKVNQSVRFATPENHTSSTSPTLNMPLLLTPRAIKRYLSGHRAVTRRQYHRRVPPELNMFCKSPSTSDDERTIDKAFMVGKVSRASGMIQAVSRLNRRPGSAIGHQQKRLLFSRKIKVYKRSSSEKSPKASKTSVDNGVSTSNASSNDDDKAPLIRNPPAQREKVERRPPEPVNEPSPIITITTASSGGSRPVGKVAESDAVSPGGNPPRPGKEIRNAQQSNATAATTRPPAQKYVTGQELLVPASTVLEVSTSMDGPETTPSLLESTDEPLYCGFGVLSDDRRGFLEELKNFSNLNALLGNDDPVISEQVEAVQAASPEKGTDILLEIRDLLHQTLAKQDSPQWRIPSIETSAVTSPPCTPPDSYQAARPENCRAFGTGLREGVVGIKNNFQVEATQAGNGTLTVAINSPHTHTVTETSISYTGDNLYDVIYEVTQPGYYVITIKWSDISITSSPFVCKVSYCP